MRQLFIACLLVSFLDCYGVKYLPKGFPVCKRTDKNLNKCILEATELAKPMLAKGIPELNLPPMEPFFFDQVVIQQGTKALNFKATIRKVLVHGLSNYTCTKFDFDVKKLFFDATCKFDRLLMEGDYDIEGNILAAPIAGSGNFSGTLERNRYIFGGNITESGLKEKIDRYKVWKIKLKLHESPPRAASVCSLHFKRDDFLLPDNCEGNITEQARIEVKKGIEYLIGSETKASLHFERPRGRLDGLFGGNKELGDLMNKLLNENADDFFEEMVPILEKLLKEMLENVLLKAFNKVPYDELFPK